MRLIRMVRLAFPAFKYKSAYIGELFFNNYLNDEHTLRTTINIIETVNFNIENPISPLGTNSTKINMNAIKDIFRHVFKESRPNQDSSDKFNNYFPIIFTEMKLSTDNQNSLVISGIVLDLEKNGKDLWFLFGNSKYFIKNTKGARGNSKCENKNCRVYLFLIIDEYVMNALKGVKEYLKCEKDCNYEIIINENNTNKVSAVGLNLYIFKLRDVKTFLRSYAKVDTTNSDESANEIYYNDDHISINLEEGDAEIIHIGSQIVGKGWGYNNSLKNRKKYMYYLSPIIIPYPMSVPEEFTRNNNSYNVTLPKDTILRTAIIELNIKDFSWNKSIKLIDWLWEKHKDSVFKLLLNKQVIDSLIKLMLGGKYIPKLYNIESKIYTKLYDEQIVTYSPNLNKIVNAYYSVRKNNANSIIGVTKNFLLKLSEGEVIENDINKDVDEISIKYLLSIFALIYGLHGISHILMKMLTMSTGLTDYGENIYIKIDTEALKNQKLYPLVNALQNTLGYDDVIHEGLYKIDLKDSFETKLQVFSREPYSFNYYYNALVDKNDNKKFNINLAKDLFNKLLTHHGTDVCTSRWEIEKKLLIPHRQELNSDPMFLNADNIIRDNLSTMFTPPRSIFRFIYDYKIKNEILNKTVKSGNKNQSKENERTKFLENLNKKVQYMWPYHLPQCSDGCYGCVLLERNIKATTCDLTPLAQELKISKWAALCLLKYMGLFNASWVDCDL